MGCGASKSNGREDYSNLRADSSPNVPLVSAVSARPTTRELLVIPDNTSRSSVLRKSQQETTSYTLPAEPSTPSLSIDPFQSIVTRDSPNRNHQPLVYSGIVKKSTTTASNNCAVKRSSVQKSALIPPPADKNHITQPTSLPFAFPPETASSQQAPKKYYHQEIRVVPTDHHGKPRSTTVPGHSGDEGLPAKSAAPSRRKRSESPRHPGSTTEGVNSVVSSVATSTVGLPPATTSTPHSHSEETHKKRNKKKKKKRNSKSRENKESRESTSRATKETTNRESEHHHSKETRRHQESTHRESKEATTTRKPPKEPPSRMSNKQTPRTRLSQKAFSVFSLETPQPCSKSGMKFEELYKLKGVLGTGAFSTVREGQHRTSTDITYAVKCVNRKKLSEEDEAALLDEVAILKEMKHPHIIRLYDFFVTPLTYYLVMEKMSGGELFDRIVAKAYYNEKEARNVCKILIEAVGHCHSNKVAHRDLKPENLLLLAEDDDSAVKIADFGFAKRVLKPNSLTTQCGTPGYVAPEILEGIPYDQKADMWSCGVILYILLGGYPPFIENNQRELFRKIRKGDYEFHPEYWQNVSSEAKDLISALLTIDPMKRLDAEQAAENEWIREADDDDLEKKDLGPNLAELKKFNAKRKFKAAVYGVMASNKLQSLGQDFQKNLS